MALPKLNFDFKANIKWVIDSLSDYAKDGHILHIHKIGTVVHSSADLSTQYDISVDFNAGAVKDEYRFVTAGMVTKLSMEVSSIENIFDCRVDMRPDPNHETQLCVKMTLMWKAPW